MNLQRAMAGPGPRSAPSPAGITPPRRVGTRSPRGARLVASGLWPFGRGGAGPDGAGAGYSTDEPYPSETPPYFLEYPTEKVRGYAEVAYLTGRAKVVSHHFSTALGIDDFLHRLEIALHAYGFNGDNSIGEWASCRIN